MSIYATGPYSMKTNHDIPSIPVVVIRKTEHQTRLLNKFTYVNSSPLPQPVANTIPKPQLDTLLPSPFNIPPIKRIAQILHAPSNPHLILRLQSLNLFLRLSLLNRLLHLHYLHQRRRVQLVLLRAILRCNVNPVPFTEKILRALERVRECTVCFVDSGGEGFRVLLRHAGRVFVWVGDGLELEEFATQVAYRDFEGGCRGWTGWKGLWEDCVVVCDIRGSRYGRFACFHG